MKKLEIELIDLAHGFAQQLLGVVRESSVADVRDALGGASGAAIVELLQTRRAGMRATEIRAALGMSQGVFAELATECLRTKKIVRTGVRRGTRYFAR